MVEIVLLEDPRGTSVCACGRLMGDMLSPLFLTLSCPPDRYRIFLLNSYVFN